MTRNRLEDLGRLLVLLENISQSKLFQEFERFSKHYEVNEWLKELTPEKQSDFFHDLRFWVRDLEEQISECVSIARAHDDLNYNDDQSNIYLSQKNFPNTRPY